MRTLLTCMKTVPLGIRSAASVQRSREISRKNQLAVKFKYYIFLQLLYGIFVTLDLKHSP